MRNGYVILLKVLVHIACLLPLAILVWQAVQNTLGPDPTATLSHGTGFAALRILIISLAITPVRRLSKHLAFLVRFRRMLGLYAFFYASIHLLVYLKLYAYMEPATIVTDLTKRRYIIIGFAAWLLLLPLAATSTKWAIRKLGKRWQLLHRVVYVAAVCGVVHYWWIVKKGVLSPVTLTVILTVLLLARAAWTLLEARRRERRRALSLS